MHHALHFALISKKIGPVRRLPLRLEITDRDYLDLAHLAEVAHNPHLPVTIGTTVDSRIDSVCELSERRHFTRRVVLLLCAVTLAITSTC